MKELINYYLIRYSLVNKKKFSEKLETIGITYPQWTVLKTIKNHENGITAKNISDILHMDKATLSGVLKRLERDDYITKVQSVDDKRVQHLYLSEQSLNLCRRVMALETEVIHEVFTGLSDEEISDFLEKLKLIMKNMENM